MSKTLGGLGLNGIQLKWIIGIHDNYGTANLAHLPQKWAELAVQFSW